VLCFFFFETSCWRCAAWLFVSLLRMPVCQSVCVRPSVPRIPLPYPHSRTRRAIFLSPPHIPPALPSHDPPSPSPGTQHNPTQHSTQRAHKRLSHWTDRTHDTDTSTGIRTRSCMRRSPLLPFSPLRDTTRHEQRGADTVRAEDVRSVAFRSVASRFASTRGTRARAGRSRAEQGGAGRSRAEQSRAE
jgi:hypothetical protein